MAKERKKVLHIHSNIKDRQPKPGTLEPGELAVNYNADNEFISTKSASGKVVRFSSDPQIVNLMEYKEVIPYSGVVDNIHLDTNRSNIEIKFNQVVARNTKFYNKVNGATDIDNQPVNPSSDSGQTNGAGFAIDMSAYALTGGNPSFSSVTSDSFVGPSNKTLSWAYGNVFDETSGSTNFSEDKSFKIPQCVGNIKRTTLDIKYGQSVVGKTDGNYDPGEDCTSTSATKVSDTVYIPTKIDDLENWDGNCIILPHNTCVSGSLTTTAGVYNASDEALKDDIKFITGDVIARANQVKIKSFYYKSDETKRKTYGVIAQDVEQIGLEELVHYDSSGMRSVDYTGLLLLKIAALEKEIDLLKHKLEEK